jgi:hypothetical protein
MSTPKQALIDKFNETAVKNVHGSDVKYVVIHFSRIPWCKFDPLECIFGEEDSFEEFSQELIKILQQHYPKQSKDIIGLVYSDSTNKYYYRGKAFDLLNDNDILYLTKLKYTHWQSF